MITPYLEKLIHEGKADYRTHAFGASSVGGIPVQSNSRLIITDFIWSPFNDGIIADTNVNPDRIIKTMRLVSGRRRWIWNFRDYQTSSGNAAVPSFGAPYKIDCYCQCDETVNIDIWIATILAAGGFTTGGLEPISNEDQTPIGYGTSPPGGIAVNIIARLISGGNVVPASNVRAPGAYVTAGSNQRNEFYSDITAGLGNSALVGSLREPYRYPLVTFGYVVINQIKTSKNM